MSTLDLSRHLTQPKKHYVGARLQQGRILTDADFNEAAEQGVEDQRLSLLGFIGGTLESAHASPDDGFSLGVPFLSGATPPAQTEPLRVGASLPRATFKLNGEATSVRPLTIRAGTCYLGGMRLELERAEPFMFQSEFLQMKPADIPLRDQSDSDRFWQIYYLEAWEELVTASEDHEFLEQALGGRDTSGRVRRMRRVRSFSIEGSEPTSCNELWNRFTAFLASPGDSQRNGVLDDKTGGFLPRARLSLRFDVGFNDASCFDCNPPQGSRFLGADNQTLRVLCTSLTRYVWALDDSAPLYRVKVEGLGATDPNAEIKVTLLTPPKDGEHAPRIGRVVELIPFAALLSGPSLPGPIIDPHFNKVADEVGAFSRVIRSYDPSTRSFVLANDAPGCAEMRSFVFEWDGRHPGSKQLFVPADATNPAADERFFFMRLWHEASTNDEIELVQQANPSQPLGNTGFFPQFTVGGQRGDSWTIALRPETPDKVVPFAFTGPNGMPPTNPIHFFAPLAFLRGIDDQVTVSTDCRPTLRPLTDAQCVTFTVGDGRLIKGEFTSIQEAIDTLPDEGGTVLVRPGSYIERVVIDGRVNVTLVGCGDATVLQSPDSSGTGLIRVVGTSDSIRVSGFKLRVASEVGVYVQDSDAVSIANLSVEVGEYEDGTFLQDVASSELPLIQALDATELSLGSLALRPTHRPGFLLEAVNGLVLDNVELLGTGNEPGGEPAVMLKGCHGGVLSNLSLTTFGQFGVVLDSSNREIEIVRVTASCHAAFESGGFTRLQGQAKPALDLDGQRITLRESQVVTEAGQPSTHAAVVVHGADVSVVDNELLTRAGDAGPTAFGGLQIRGGSQRITVRGNRISGGVGHGCTLGSVLWLPNSSESSDSPPPARREGAGENQMASALRGGHQVVFGTIRGFSDGLTTFRPEDEGMLEDIVIENNRIEEFSSNGISSLTVFGLGDPETPDYIEISRLRIEGNRIQNNVRRPSERFEFDRTEGATFTPILAANPRYSVVPKSWVLSYGGIVLGHVNQADIRGNLIADNGHLASPIPPIIPVNGIYVANGELLSICRNVVTNNGDPPTQNEDPLRGTRAGIAVLLAGLGAHPNHGALLTTIIGGGNSLPSDGLSVRVSDNVVRHPEGRALHIVATGPVQVDGNFLSSEGYHGSDLATQDREAIGDVVFIQNLGGPWERFNVAQTQVRHSNPSQSDRGDFTDYDSPRDAVGYLFNEVPTSPRHFIGLGGQVLFQNNQVVYDWQVRRVPGSNEPLTTFAVAIMSLDHTSVGANQFGLRIVPPAGFKPPPADPEMGTNEPFYAHVFVTGATVEVTSNRVAENSDSARLSLLALGELAFTIVHNQTMHQVHGAGANDGGLSVKFGYFGDNQEMLLKRSDHLGNSPWVYNLGVRLFMRLLNRPTALLGKPPTTTPGG